MNPSGTSGGTQGTPTTSLATPAKNPMAKPYSVMEPNKLPGGLRHKFTNGRRVRDTKRGSRSLLTPTLEARRSDYDAMIKRNSELARGFRRPGSNKWKRA